VRVAAVAGGADLPMRRGLGGGASGRDAAPADPAAPLEPSPGRRLGRIAFALGLGTLGGVVFNALTIPLPWMLGPMVFNTVAAVLRAPVLAPVRLRPVVIVVIGVMLGSGFTAEMLGDAAGWALSLGFLALYLAIAAALVIPFYVRLGRFDPVTAFFAGMPGGLNEMMILGKEYGGDDRRIALAHASRILVTVFLLALWFRFGAGLELGDRSQFGTPFAAIPTGELLVLAACGVVGFGLGKALRLPAPGLLGPMIASAVVHVAGLTDSPPPSELVVLAQIFLGTIIGCRFLGASPAMVRQAILLSVGATLIALSVALLFALGFAGLFGQDPSQVILAYAPGGLAEMSLIALAMDADLAYVATHHIVRIVLIIALAPLVFRLMRRARIGR
jgi:uncharacterized protein